MTAIDKIKSTVKKDMREFAEYLIGELQNTVEILDKSDAPERDHLAACMYIHRIQKGVMDEFEDWRKENFQIMREKMQ